MIICWLGPWPDNSTVCTSFCTVVTQIALNISLGLLASYMWKRVYKKKKGKGSMSEKTREFSLNWCRAFHAMLAGAKEEYGDYADYSFDFGEKTKKKASRKRKTKA